MSLEEVEGVKQGIHEILRAREQLKKELRRKAIMRVNTLMAQLS